MVTERLEVRLDPERRRKLRMVADRRGLAVSEVIRRLIDQAYEEEQLDLARRLLAVERIAACEVEDVPDPETINRQSESSYGVPDLY